MFGALTQKGTSTKAIFEAISNSQAVITFDPNGVIESANGLFLEAAGYNEADVIGQHHQMFVDTAYAASQEYHSFWEALRRGQAQSGVFQRVRKDGEVLWLQAHYIPVRGRNGAVEKIIKLATDVTREQEKALTDSSALDALDKSQAVIEFSTDGHVKRANSNFLSVMGYAQADIVGKHHSLFVPTEDVNSAAYEDHWKRLAAGEFISGEFCRITKSGKRVWIQATYNPVYNAQGAVTGVVKFASDITQSKAFAADAKSQLEAIYKTYATIEFDLGGQIRTANDLFLNVMGYALHDICGKHHSMFVKPEEQGSTDYEAFWEDLRSGAFKTGTFTRIAQNGEEVRIRATYNPIFDDQGKPIKIVKFAQDVTAETIAREETRQTLEQALDAVVKIDENNIVTFFNDAAEALWARSRDEVIGQNVKMLVPPQMQSSHDGFVNKNRETGEDKIVGTSREVPIHRPDGRDVWGQLSLAKVQVSGRTTYTAFVKDVTEERAQREQIRTLSLVANETDNSVVITDAHGLIEYVNPGFERMTGFSSDEVIGRKPGDILQGRDTDPATVANIRSKLAAQQPFYDEILNYTKSGEPYWISLSINPVFDDTGALNRFISIQANVTDTKTIALETRTRMQCVEQANAVVEWTPAGEVVSFNDFVMALTNGLDASGMRAAFALNTILSTDEKNEILKGRSVSKEICFNRADQSRGWLSATFMPLIDYRDAVTRIIMYATDATSRRTAIESTTDLMRDVLQQINGVADEINAVTAQTRLLSLNATIEASRAGDAGKGFAVVADEVRDLAGRTGSSTSEIAKLITSTRGKIDALTTAL